MKRKHAKRTLSVHFIAVYMCSDFSFFTSAALSYIKPYDFIPAYEGFYWGVCLYIICMICYYTLFLTLEHKNSHEGQFSEIKMYASSESWINHISIDVWFGQYLKGSKKNLNIEKKYNFDPYNVLLVIATNISVLLMTAFVLQGHIYLCV